MKIAFTTMTLLITGVVFIVIVPISDSSNVIRGSGRTHRRQKANLTVALILPKTNFGVRGYTRAINDALQSLQKTRGPKFEFFNQYGPIQVKNEMMSLTPSPTGKLKFWIFIRFSVESSFIIIHYKVWRKVLRIIIQISVCLQREYSLRIQGLPVPKIPNITITRLSTKIKYTRQDQVSWGLFKPKLDKAKSV